MATYTQKGIADHAPPHTHSKRSISQQIKKQISLHGPRNQKNKERNHRKRLGPKKRRKNREGIEGESSERRQRGDNRFLYQQLRGSSTHKVSLAPRKQPHHRRWRSNLFMAGVQGEVPENLRCPCINPMIAPTASSSLLSFASLFRRF